MLVRMGRKSLLFEYLYAHHWWSSLDLKEFRLGAVTTSSHRLFHRLYAVTEEIGSSPRITALFLELVRMASCCGVSLAL